MILFPKLRSTLANNIWNSLGTVVSAPLRLANPRCKKPCNRPPGLLITNIPWSIVLLILSFELSHRRILHGVRSTYRAKMTPVLPTTCGWCCILSRLCCSDQYHLQVLWSIHWTAHFPSRSMHSIRNGDFFFPKGNIAVQSVSGK